MPEPGIPQGLAEPETSRPSIPLALQIAVPERREELPPRRWLGGTKGVLAHGAIATALILGAAGARIYRNNIPKAPASGTPVAVKPDHGYGALQPFHNTSQAYWKVVEKAPSAEERYLAMREVESIHSDIEFRQAYLQALSHDPAGARIYALRDLQKIAQWGSTNLDQARWMITQ